VTSLPRASLKVAHKGALTHPKMMTTDRREVANFESILAEEKY
jgi:hypothetical protein